jgi:hypothetical protein
MDAEKRKIIVKEIEQWRRSRILPEHYCDFLLNLYLEDGAEKPKSVMGVSAASISNSNWKNWMIGLAVVCAISYSALNFNSFGIPMQMGVSALFVFICYWLGFSKKSKAPIFTSILCGVASLSLLFIGVYLLDLHGINDAAAYVGYVAFCSVIWMLTGLLGRMSVFHFCGWIGLIGAYGWLLHKNLTEPGWIALQISWVPIALLFIWIAWFVHHKNKQITAVLFAVGCLTFLAPEGYGLLVEGVISSEFIQLLLMVKLIAGVVSLFALRKKWIEWVM